MKAGRHIVGSESLHRRALAPGYGAIHRGVGLRRRTSVNLAAVSIWSLVAVCALLAGMLSGLPSG